MSPVYEYLCDWCAEVFEYDEHDAELECPNCDSMMRRTWTVNFARVPGGGRD
jgi:predicted nucleic acid-binding Zn ribbon protein